ncbi:MAG: glycerol acyltransferase [Bacteroidales bacterium]|mgnify:FL=1|nr:glycerol acyltransferase [Bacteroidales bacterium]MDD7232548.1 glycerol acyltransferase [Bacteroidales bacterium]MDY2705292.1 glycerol acyltransferase [Alloprevotella sp.]
MQPDKAPFQIDIDEILRSKAGPKAKRIPRFIVAWLKRRLHQDQVNDFLRIIGDKEGVPWLKGCLDFLDTKLEVKGLENLPSDADGRRFTFVSNHPLGGQDGVALGYVLGTHYDGRIKYLVNDLLMFLPGLAPLCIPINKTGKQSRQFPAMVEAGFSGDDHILMFPAGLCSRRRHGVIRDLPWNKTFITKSVQHQRDVVPIYFSGRNSNKFYTIANICKMFGLKFNLAMLYLVDELFKNQHKTFEVHIGRPIPWQTFDRSRTATQWAAYVQDIVYQLKP